MTARTPEEFEDELAREIGWRRAELRRLRLEIEAASGPTQEMLLRAGATLLYAHWEGFVRGACQSYIRYVSVRRLKIEELNTSLAAMAVRSRLQSLALERADHCIEAYTYLLEARSERARLKVDQVVKTESNLNSGVLLQLLWSLGLPTDEYMAKAQLLDRSLLRVRNEVAHGRHMTHGLPGYLELHDQIEALLSLLRNQLSNAVVERSYRAG